MFGLDIQASVKEIEKTLREQGKLSEWDYLKDHTFREYVLDNHATEQQAREFAALLNSQTPKGCCSKARTILSYLDEDGFFSSKDGIVYLLSYARRTCCCCHENSCYHPLENPW